jgi:proteasome assembly chaperone (PAC2) family protein
VGPMQEPGSPDDLPEIRWEQQPQLRKPVVVAAFEGWNDAGDAATHAARWLRGRWEAERFATIDPEKFYDFATARPRVELSADGERRLHWADTEISACSVNGSTTDAIFVVGLEPHLRWRTFCDQVVGLAERYDARTVITLGALLAEVPHTRPVIIYGSSEHEGFAEDLRPSSYEGPTGIVGVLHGACRDAGLASASLWAAVPTYLPGASSPKAALALISRLAKLLETSVETGSLEAESEVYEQHITSMVEEDEDTALYVRELEERYDADVGNDPDDLDAETASPEELVAEVERFLREQ